MSKVLVMHYETRGQYVVPLVKNDRSAVARGMLDCVQAINHVPHILPESVEFERRDDLTLTMHYGQRSEVRVPIDPWKLGDGFDNGAMGDAMLAAMRLLEGMPNLQHDSIRFELIDADE